MKKIIFFVTTLVLGSSLYATDGAEIYKKCNACHGQYAEKKYANKVPPLVSVSKEDRLKALEGYKTGTANLYGMGAVMKTQMIKLSMDDIKAVNDFIETLK
ncbi:MULTISPECIES: c-type cytochrome [unclassified Campylobacter]|uniref:c-type cytochrome n=1 Tax=unclassified Campylobacter TaxID=2593542 RepID=UPI001474509E|nr:MULTISPECIES: c-type cytochrome [unclassified Campylobacter]QKG29874.1 periplasmic monoheme cytochrome c553 [Campylobacter sp. RM16187]